MKRVLTLGLCLTLILSGCSFSQAKQQKYSATFLDIFNTVTTVVGFSESEEAFTAQAQKIKDELLEYHRLFDIYHEYEGLANLKTVNDGAGIAPVQVDGRIIALLKDCKTYYTLTGGTVNVAMGSVLALWHEARTDGLDDPMNAYLPDTQALLDAAGHRDMDALIIDEAASTVYLADPETRLDVGAIAKGWAVEQVCKNAPAGLLVSVGGNIRTTGPKDSQGTPWVVGVQDPDDNAKNLHTLNITGGSVVTSGDYQRRYWVDGAEYHHIIDPETLFPGTLWRSVTIVCPDSGLADALSTALFLLPLEDGMALLQTCGAEAMWVDRDGTCRYSPGFEAIIRT